MIDLIFPDGSKRPFDDGVTGKDVATSIAISLAKRAVLVTQNALEVAIVTRDLAREQDRLARISFEIGKATSFELIDAGRLLRSAEISLAARELDVVQARIAAYMALSSCTW